MDVDVLAAVTDADCSVDIVDEEELVDDVGEVFATLLLEVEELLDVVVVVPLSRERITPNAAATRRTATMTTSAIRPRPAL